MGGERQIKSSSNFGHPKSVPHSRWLGLPKPGQGTVLGGGLLNLS